MTASSFKQELIFYILLKCFLNNLSEIISKYQKNYIMLIWKSYIFSKKHHFSNYLKALGYLLGPNTILNPKTIHIQYIFYGKVDLLVMGHCFLCIFQLRKFVPKNLIFLIYWHFCLKKLFWEFSICKLIFRGLRLPLNQN